MKITPKLLVGQFIMEDNISKAEKIIMLTEIVHLNDEELEVWIESAISQGHLSVLKEAGQSFFLNAAQKAAKKATEKEAATIAATKAAERVAKSEKYANSVRGKVGKAAKDTIEGAKNAASNAKEHPFQTIGYAGAVGVTGAVAYNQVAKRLNRCKENCMEQYRVTKNKDYYAACMTNCQQVANRAKLNKARAGAQE